jgi:opacity protein-like surface antigen
MKRLFFVLLFSLVALLSNAQNGLNLNLFLGTSNYSGDLQDKRFTFSQAHLAGGIGLSYDITNHLSVRTAFKIGKISADDKLGKNKARNLNFSSGLTEGDLDVQYLITPLGEHVLTPYVFAGVAVYHYDPYTFDSSGRKYYLKTLSTEGEGFIPGRKNYSLTEFSIPFGAGVKMPLSENINVGFEIGYRKLFTDYLDDVSTTYVDPNLLLVNRGAKAVELSYRGGELKTGSTVYPVGGQRGNPSSKDQYYFTGLTLSFRLGNSLFGNGGGGSGKNSEWNCPKNVL